MRLSKLEGCTNTQAHWENSLGTHTHTQRIHAWASKWDATSVKNSSLLSKVKASIKYGSFSNTLIFLLIKWQLMLGGCNSRFCSFNIYNLKVVIKRKRRVTFAWLKYVIVAMTRKLDIEREKKKTYLWHQLYMLRMGPKNLTDINKIWAFAYKWKSNHINFVGNTPFQNVFLIFVCQSRKIHYNTRKIDIFSLTQHGSVLTTASHSPRIWITRQDSEGDGAICTQDGVSRLYVHSQLFVAHGDHAPIPLDAVISSYSDFLTFFKLNRFWILKKTSSNLRSLQEQREIIGLSVNNRFNL